MRFVELSPLKLSLQNRSPINFPWWKSYDSFYWLALIWLFHISCTLTIAWISRWLVAKNLSLTARMTTLYSEYWLTSVELGCFVRDMEEVVLAVAIAECCYKKLEKLLLRKQRLKSQQLRKQLLRKQHQPQQLSLSRLDVQRNLLLRQQLHLLKVRPY